MFNAVTGVIWQPNCLLRNSLFISTFVRGRNVMTWRKVRRLCREFWYPAPDKPPFTHICQIGDPVLRTKAELVRENHIGTKKLKELIKQLHNVMQDYGSVGLSAPQIGIPLQIFVSEFPQKAVDEFAPETFKIRQMSVYPLKVFINPKLKIIDYTKIKFPEACESIRGFSAEVERYKEVIVSGLDEDGKAISWQVSGWPARIVQHEMDHLTGRLFTDIMDRSSFTCTCWEKVNRTKGKIYVPFAP